MSTMVFEFKAVPLSQSGPLRMATGQSVVPIGAAEMLTFSASSVGGTAWSTGVLTVRVAHSQSGPWFAVPGGGSHTLTSAHPACQAIDVRGWKFATLDVTTTQSGAAVDVAAGVYQYQ